MRATLAHSASPLALIWILLTGGCDGASGLLGLGAGPEHPSVVVNEVASRNQSAISANQNDTPDWIELYNQSDQELNLAGYYLSDKTEEPRLFRIPNGTTIAAHGVRLFWSGEADNDETTFDFALNGSGDLVLLSSPSGRVLDSVRFGASEPDRAYARRPDGHGEWAWSHSPSPGARNVGAPAPPQNPTPPSPR